MKKEPAINTKPHDAHPSDDEIVGYMENTLSKREMGRIRKHLHACPRCFDAYHDSILMRGVWGADESAFEPPEVLRELGLQLAAGKALRERAVPAGSQVRSRQKKLYRLGIAAAGAVIILIAAIWLLQRDEIVHVGDAVLDTAALRPVRSAMETVSMRGSFVLPGGERSLDAVGSAFRSGFVPLSDSLESSLRYLQQAFEKGDTHPDVAYWLIGGCIATGQIDAARDFASHPRVVRMNDMRIDILQAIVAYMDGNHERAERLLRDILTEYPTHAVASINLAVILREGGAEEESRAILHRIARDHAGTPLARRAQAILSNGEDE